MCGVCVCVCFRFYFLFVLPALAFRKACGKRLCCVSLVYEVVKCMDEFIPKTKCNQNKKCTPLWMNDKVLKKIKKRSKLFQRYLLMKDGKDYSKYPKM